MQRYLVIGLVVWGAWGFLFSSPAPSLPDGSKPVKTETKFHVTAPSPRVDGEILAYDGAGAPLGHWWLDRGRVYEPVDGPPNRGRLEIVKHRILYDPGLDIGTFAAKAGGDVPGFQVGVRASPVRLLYGTLSPDVAVTKDGAGIGVSGYLPADYFGRWWNHIGAGCWYLFPYDGGDPGFAVGLSFSTLP